MAGKTSADIDVQQQLQLPAQFKVKLLEKFKADCVEAELTSALLDPVLHPAGSVRISIAAEASAGKKGPPFAVDVFAAESLREYLRTQAEIRQMLEKELLRDRKRWDKTKMFARGNVWEQAMVGVIAFEKKNVPTPEGLANMKAFIPNFDVKRAAAIGDNPDTRSTFTLQLNVLWDAEHWRLASFRDGALVELAL